MENRRKSDKWYYDLAPAAIKAILFIAFSFAFMKFSIEQLKADLGQCQVNLSQAVKDNVELKVKVSSLETALPYIADKLKSIDDQLKDIRRSK